MSTEQRDRTDARRLALLAPPVLCCAGHAVLVALSLGSLAAFTGAATGRVLIAVAGLISVAAVLAVVRRRRR